MPKIEERLLGRVFVLTTDAKGRPTMARILGMRVPWLELDPERPLGEMHFDNFGDKSVWQNGVHHEETGGPWESEHDTPKPYETFVADELMSLRHTFVTLVPPKSAADRKAVFAYACEHRLISSLCHISNSALDAIVEAHGAKADGGAFLNYCASLIENDAVWRYAGSLMKAIETQAQETRARAERAVTEWFVTKLTALVGENEAAEPLHRELDQLTRRVASTKLPLLQQLFSAATTELAPGSPAIADLTLQRALDGGRPRDVIELLAPRAEDADVEIHVLNNLSAAYLAAKEIAEAELIFERIRRRLDARGPAPLDRLSRELQDEYFHLTNRVRMLWNEARYADALTDARRVYELERAMQRLSEYTHPLGGGRVCPVEVAFATGAWCCVSVLTRTGNLEEGVVVADEVLGDELQMQARFQRSQEQTESLLVGITCLFLEPQTDAMIELSRPRFARTLRLCRQPGGGLGYGYACLYSRYADADNAIAWLRYAKQRGFGVEAAAKDPDFRSLYLDPRFKKLVGGG